MNQVLVLNNREKITVNIVLTSNEETLLENAYPEFTIVWKRRSKVGHPFAAVSRMLEMQQLLSLTNYTAGTEISSQQHDTYVTDVGGNWYTHYKKTHDQVHSCVPKLSIRDIARQVTRLTAVYTEKKSTMQSDHAQTFLYPGDKWCNVTAQECKTTSLFCVFLHSTYDMTVEDITAIMVNKKSVIAYGCFIFDPIILIKDTDIIKPLGVRYHINRITRKIRFHYDNDTSLGYDHDLDTYLSLITRSILRHRESGNIFLHELTYNRCGIQFFKITAVGKDAPLSTETLFHTIWPNPSESEKTLVRFFSVDRSTKKPISGRKVLRPIFLLTPTELFESILSYALQLDDTRFVIREVFSYARSANTRVIVKGTSVMTPERIPAEDLYTLACAIYVHAYCIKYTSGLTTKQLLEDEKTRREYMNKSVLGILCDLICLGHHSQYKTTPSWREKIRNKVYNHMYSTDTNVVKFTGFVNYVSFECTLRHLYGKESIPAQDNMYPYSNWSFPIDEDPAGPLFQSFGNMLTDNFREMLEKPRILTDTMNAIAEQDPTAPDDSEFYFKKTDIQMIDILNTVRNQTPHNLGLKDTTSPTCGVYIACKKRKTSEFSERRTVRSATEVTMANLHDTYMTNIDSVTADSGTRVQIETADTTDCSALQCTPPPSVKSDYSDDIGTEYARALSSRNTRELVICQPTETFTEEGTDGDGNCILYSLMGKSDKKQAAALRKEMLQSRELRYWPNLREKREMVRILSTDNEWCNDDIVMLYAVNHDVRVCVHTDTRYCTLMGPIATTKPNIHIRIVGGHCTRLRDKSMPPIDDDALSTRSFRSQTSCSSIEEHKFPHNILPLLPIINNQYGAAFKEIHVLSASYSGESIANAVREWLPLKTTVDIKLGANPKGLGKSAPAILLVDLHNINIDTVNDLTQAIHEKSLLLIVTHGQPTTLLAQCKARYQHVVALTIEQVSTPIILIHKISISQKKYKAVDESALRGEAASILEAAGHNTIPRDLLTRRHSVNLVDLYGSLRAQSNQKTIKSTTIYWDRMGWVSFTSFINHLEQPYIVWSGGANPMGKRIRPSKGQVQTLPMESHALAFTGLTIIMLDRLGDDDINGLLNAIKTHSLDAEAPRGHVLMVAMSQQIPPAIEQYLGIESQPHTIDDQSSITGPSVSILGQPIPDNQDTTRHTVFPKDIAIVAAHLETTYANGINFECSHAITHDCAAILHEGITSSTKVVLMHHPRDSFDANTHPNVLVHYIPGTSRVQWMSTLTEYRQLSVFLLGDGTFAISALGGYHHHQDNTQRVITLSAMLTQAARRTEIPSIETRYNRSVKTGISYYVPTRTPFPSSPLIVGSGFIKYIFPQISDQSLVVCQLGETIYHPRPKPSCPPKYVLILGDQRLSHKVRLLRYMTEGRPTHITCVTGDIEVLQFITKWAFKYHHLPLKLAKILQTHPPGANKLTQADHPEPPTVQLPYQQPRTTTPTLAAAPLKQTHDQLKPQLPRPPRHQGRESNERASTTDSISGDSDEFWLESRAHLQHLVTPLPVYEPPTDRHACARNSAREQIYYWKEYERTLVKTYSQYYNRYCKTILSKRQKKMLYTHRENLGIIDATTGSWILEPRSPAHYEAAFDGSGFVPITYNAHSKKFCVQKSPAPDRLLVGSSTQLLNDTRLYNAVKHLENTIDTYTFPPIEMVEGVPGCGKTQYILTRCDPDKDLVVTCTREAAMDMRKRMSVSEREKKKNFLTAHSYLINCGRRAHTLWFDEALMKHPGEIMLLAVMSQCTSVKLLGDPNQIPFVNRTTMRLKHTSYSPLITAHTHLNTTYRCPLSLIHI